MGKQRAWNALLLASGISVSTTVAFASTADPGRRAIPEASNNNNNNNCVPSQPLATTGICTSETVSSSSFVKKAASTTIYPEKSSTVSSRTYQTPADKFYAQHGVLPTPSTIHAVLKKEDDGRRTQNDSTSASNSKDQHNNSNKRKNILVIGDVHGCLEELQLLHKKAVEEENDNQDFQHVILVGDLCNKGPSSVAVIKHVLARRREEQNWHAVRGNHDDGALTASLGDLERRRQPKYQWVTEQSQPETTLSDDDVMFLAELPYTLRIPKHVLGGDSLDRETLIVHAGLVPGVPLEDQTIDTMITIREVQKNLSTGEYVNRKRSTKGGDQDCLITENNFGEPIAWAKAWQGPYQVIFGHDARRGYQRYEGDWAIGLDTGACYGKKLTGLILPSKKIVSIDSLETYCPI